MYQNIMLTSIYFGNFPIHTTSTNEPNKGQINKLIRQSMIALKLDGDLKYEKFNQDAGVKVYQFILGEIKVAVTVQRLPIISFEKDSDEYKFSSMDL